MTRDPNQLFVINAFIRKSIAEDAENIRTCCGYKHPNDPQEITEDDDRLTDEICQTYADAFSDTDGMGDDEIDELGNNALANLLEAMGYVNDNNDDTDDTEQAALVAEIRQDEIALAMKRALLQQLEKTNESDHLQTPNSTL